MMEALLSVFSGEVLVCNWGGVAICSRNFSLLMCVFTFLVGVSDFWDGKFEIDMVQL